MLLNQCAQKRPIPTLPPLRCIKLNTPGPILVLWVLAALNTSSKLSIHKNPTFLWGQAPPHHPPVSLSWFALAACLQALPWRSLPQQKKSLNFPLMDIFWIWEAKKTTMAPQKSRTCQLASTCTMKKKTHQTQHFQTPEASRLSCWPTHILHLQRRRWRYPQPGLRARAHSKQWCTDSIPKGAPCRQFLRVFFVGEICSRMFPPTPKKKKVLPTKVATCNLHQLAGCQTPPPFRHLQAFGEVHFNLLCFGFGLGLGF